MVNPQPASSDRIHVTRSRAKPGGAGTEVEGAIPFRSRKPPWLKVPPPGGPTYRKLKATIGDEGLNTVCEEANCPNIGECWERGTATFMILGDVCTRGCRFCAVTSGNPRGWLDPLEPKKCADTVAAMNLRYVVVTCVDRDDLPDGGAGQFAAVIRAIRERKPDCFVEVLTSDYGGKREDIGRVLEAAPDVFAHNVETVKRLTPTVRDRRAGYELSLSVLAQAKQMEPKRITKTSLMLGLGETRDEILETLTHIRDARVDVVTLGQYLQPSRKHLAVASYLAPEVFDELAERAREMGFLYVASGPLVRSSYKAGEYFLANHLARERAYEVRGGAIEV